MDAKKELIKALEDFDYTVEIREKGTDNYGIANANDSKCEYVRVYYGSDDGSDDAVISFADFEKRFEITEIIDERD